MKQEVSLSGCVTPSKFITVCRLLYGMDMLCIVCELVVAVCTLVHLFNLQHSVVGGQEWALENGGREKALGFLSLGLTLATLVVMAIGTEKLVQSGRTVVARVTGKLRASLIHSGVTKVHGHASMSLGDLSGDVDGAGDVGQAMADNKGLSGS